jgi:hypothetical protein
MEKIIKKINTKMGMGIAAFWWNTNIGRKLRNKTKTRVSERIWKNISSLKWSILAEDLTLLWGNFELTQKQFLIIINIVMETTND